MMNLKAMAVSGLAALAATFALAAETVDPRGPIEYPGMKAAADAEGVQAPGLHLPQRVPETVAVAGKVDLAGGRPECGGRPCFARKSRWPKRRGR